MKPLLRTALLSLPALLLAAACSAEVPEEEGTVSAAEALSNPTADRAVACRCNGNDNCPAIGGLQLPGHKNIPAYCNTDNYGAQGTYGWLWQCMEFSNRFLVEALGAPIIPGAGAQDMCASAPRNAYDVYTGNSAHVPVPGDVLVWQGGTFGHTAIVSRVTAASLEYVQQNFGLSPYQYPVGSTKRVGNYFSDPVLDHSLHAKCIIHPKVLGSAGAPAACGCFSGDGLYCGSAVVAYKGAHGCAVTGAHLSGGSDPQHTLDPRFLYRCTGGTWTIQEECNLAGKSCKTEAAGVEDHCL